jgi:hypothetical protein
MEWLPTVTGVLWLVAFCLWAWACHWWKHQQHAG